MSYICANNTWCEINLSNLEYNYLGIKSLVGGKTEIMPVIKADAYGHGAIECGKVLQELGAKTMAVATIEEGMQLRKAGITTDILVFGYIPLNAMELITKWDITPTVYTFNFAQKLSQINDRLVKVHVKIDTGMGRLGFKGMENIIENIRRIYLLNNIFIEGIYSHFASADIIDKSYSIKQIREFQTIIQGLMDMNINIPIRHMANSAGIIDLPQSYYNYVRPGIMLYGMYPSPQVNESNIEIRPVKTLKTVVSNLKVIKKGDSVSYNRTYIALSDIKVATLSVGYADGYSRSLSNRGEVLIHGVRANIIGRICMDQCMADVTYIDNVKIGDEVILYGEGLPIEELAHKIGTINYEISCMTKERVAKLYFLEEKLIKMDNYLLD